MLQKNNVCFNPPTMPSADFSHAVRVDCSPLSQFQSHATFQGTWETSRGKTQSFPRVNAGFIKHIPVADGGLHGHVPTRPGCATPQIRFLYVARAFGLGFLQTPPRDDALALLLTLGSANTWCEDLHLASSVPCPAHTQNHLLLVCSGSPSRSGNPDPRRRCDPLRPRIAIGISLHSPEAPPQNAFALLY